MKILKINENANFNADLFAKKIGDKFFSGLKEFHNISVDFVEDFNEFYISITFVASIFPNTIKQIEEFNLFIDLKKDDWNLDIEKDKNEAYYTFFLSNKLIDKYLEKLKITKAANKYNL